MNNNLSLYIPYIPEIFLFVCINVIFFYGSFYNSGTKTLKFFNISYMCTFLSISALVNTLLLLGSTCNQDVCCSTRSSSTVALEIFLILGTIVVLLGTLNYNIKMNISVFEYNVFILISLMCLIFLLNTRNLLFLYLILELQGILSYVLTSFRNKSKFSIEAGVKYFILGSFSSVFMLFGVALVYGLTGVFGLDEILILMGDIALVEGADRIIKIAISVGFSFVYVGLFFKVYCAPLHYWIPDIYQGAPTSTVFYFVVCPTIVMLTLIIKIYLLYLGELSFFFKNFFMVGSALSMWFGTIGAIAQTKIKKLMAFSTVGLIGNSLMVLTVGGVGSLTSLYFMIVLYTITSMGIFLILCNLFQNNQPIESIDFFSFINTQNKYLAFFLSLFLFSLSGIPALSDFYSKFFLFNTVCTSSEFYLLCLGLSLSVLGTFNYIRLIKLIYFNKKESLHHISIEPLNLGISYLITLISLLNVFLWLNPQFLSDTILYCILSDFL